jgi:toxin-antitoxin system PIN domain toxin
MRMIDVNVLIYAHRADDPSHAFYRPWLERLASGPEPFALSLEVATAFVRIVTHRRFPGGPTPLPQAMAVIDTLRLAPGCRLLAAGERHWELFRGLCESARATGKQVGDAHHAAIALEHGCIWVTRDTDFEAFVPTGLRLEILRAPSSELLAQSS